MLLSLPIPDPGCETQNVVIIVAVVQAIMHCRFTRRSVWGPENESLYRQCRKEISYSTERRETGVERYWYMCETYVKNYIQHGSIYEWSKPTQDPCVVYM